MAVSTFGFARLSCSPTPSISQIQHMLISSAARSCGTHVIRRTRAPQSRLITAMATPSEYTPTPASQGAPQGKLGVDPLSYPAVRRDDSVVDVLHGVSIPDPYRWLEDPDAEETKAFVDAQNTVTAEVLAQCPTRAAFGELFERLYNYERFGVPFRKGNRYYYSHNSGLQAQNVIYTLNSLDDPEPKVFVDPNVLSDDGTIALMQYAFSDDGNLVAMAFSSGGSDWRRVEVSSIDPATGARTELPDVLEHVKFTSLAWTHDNLGFFYNSYAPPETAGPLGTETTKNVNQLLRYHVLGRPQSEDAVVLAIPEQPEWMIGASVSHCGRYLLLSVSSGCEPTNRLWTVDLNAVPRTADGALDFSGMDFFKGSTPLPLNKLVDDFDASWDYIGTGDDGSWTLMTNLNAPREKLVRGDPAGGVPPTQWPAVLEEHPKDVLQWASKLKGDAMITCYLADVKSALQLRRFSDGSIITDVPIGVASVGGFSGSRKYSEFFFSVTGFTEPGAQYRCDAADPAPTPSLFRRIKTAFDPDAFETKQVFVPSKDGTKVPMFIVHRRDRDMTASDAPTLLYGYGGFNISLEPGFSVARLCWLLAYDGVLAVANARGGGEYGREWRDAGSLGNKQNVFDDFISCAEYLQREKITSPGKLAIQGGSNGGLLVAACINQRPDLFAVGLAQVGVMDMLRFRYFTIGHAWCTDYGDVEHEEAFNWLIKYSPLHNVAVPEGGSKSYPAMMLTTGDHDDRVVPLHTHKLLAQLQHVLGGDGSEQRNPLLGRIEVRAGHGAGKPVKKIIEETSDMFAFAAGVMGAEWKASEDAGPATEDGAAKL